MIDESQETGAEAKSTSKQACEEMKRAIRSLKAAQDEWARKDAIIAVQVPWKPLLRYMGRTMISMLIQIS